MNPDEPTDYTSVRDAYRAQDKRTQAESPKTSAVADFATALAMPFRATKSLKGAVAQGGLVGGAYGSGMSEASTLKDLIRDAGLGVGGGALAGGAAHGVSKVPGAIRDFAGGKVKRALDAIAGMAEKEGAGPTATARSAAGREAQGAYRQLENLRDTGALGSLRGEAADVAERLTQELTESSAANIGPAAARKAESAATLREVAAGEPARVAEAAARIGNPMNQAKPWLRRYMVPVVGGAALGAVTGEGDLVDRMGRAGIGAAAGRGVSPMLQSSLRRLSHPSSQKALFGALERMAGGAARVPTAAVPAASRTAAPELRELMARLTGEDEPPEGLATGDAAMREFAEEIRRAQKAPP